MTVGSPPFMANTTSELEDKLRGPDEPEYPRTLSPSLRYVEFILLYFLVYSF